jgi:hypothetical protein
MPPLSRTRHARAAALLAATLGLAATSLSQPAQAQGIAQAQNPAPARQRVEDARERQDIPLTRQRVEDARERRNNPSRLVPFCTRLSDIRSVLDLPQTADRRAVRRVEALEAAGRCAFDAAADVSADTAARETGADTGPDVVLRYGPRPTRRLEGGAALVAGRPALLVVRATHPALGPGYAWCVPAECGAE